MRRKFIKSMLAMAVTTSIVLQGASVSATEQNITEEVETIESAQDTVETVNENEASNDNEAIDQEVLEKQTADEEIANEEEDEVINIRDRYLKEALNFTLGQEKNSNITKSQLESIVDLDLSSYPVENIEELKYCTNLTRANLSHGLIYSIEPLAELKNLKELDLSYNIVWDLSPLSNLTNLEKLNLDDNYISDLNPLANLVNLKELSISESKYVGIEDIKGGEYKITNLNVIKNFKSLETLILSNNRLSDLSFLEGASQLKSLDLSNNSISDITYLKDLMNLEYLNLSFNEIYNFTNLPKINYTNGLVLREQKILLNYVVAKNGEDIEVDNIFKDAYGDAITINLINGNGEYLKESNTIRWKALSGLSSLNYGFEGTIKIAGKDYAYSGTAEHYIYYKEDEQDQNNKQEPSITDKTTSPTKTNKTTYAAKKSSVPKTGDAGTFGMVGMSISSLVGLVLSKKRK